MGVGVILVAWGVILVTTGAVRMPEATFGARRSFFLPSLAALGVLMGVTFGLILEQFSVFF